MYATGKTRAVKKTRDDSLGDLMIVNEGNKAFDMKCDFVSVQGDDGMVEMSKMPTKKVLREVYGLPERKTRQILDSMDEPDSGDEDIPEWLNGVAVEELPGNGEDVKLEFEYVDGTTAFARRITDDGKEEWVFTVDDGVVALTSKLEFGERFGDRDWVTVASGTGQKNTQIKEQDGFDEAVKEPYILGFDVEYTGDGYVPEYADDEHVLENSLTGFVGRRYDDGTGIEFDVQVLEENKMVSRVVVNDDMYYYALEPGMDVGLEFAIPEWVVQILRVDGYLN